MAQYGDVLNKHSVLDVKSGPVKASTTLAIGLVYEDGSNGWTNAPDDGSIPARKMYWNSISIDNSSGSKGDKICVVYGHGAFVVGKADGAIALDLRVKPSDTTSHNGQFKAHTVPTVADEGDTSMTDLGAEIAAATQAVYTYFDNTIGIYRGHVQQGPESGTTRTDASDEETDIVVEIVRV